MPRELGHGCRFPVKHPSALNRLHGAQREPCRDTGPNSEDRIDCAGRTELLDRFMTIPWEPIEDQSADHISVNVNLIVVHHGASISEQPRT